MVLASPLDKKRLRWRCRRGTREMDTLLQGFLECHYEHLSPRQRICLLALLDESDLDIMAWISGQRRVPREDYYPLIQLIRQFQRKDVSTIASGTSMY